LAAKYISVYIFTTKTILRNYPEKAIDAHMIYNTEPKQAEYTYIYYEDY